MKVAISGSNGLLGAKLTELLLRQNIDAVPTSRGLCRFSNGRIAIRPYYQSLDITDRDAVFSFFETHQPDYFVNCAAMTQVDDCEKHQDKATLVNATAVKYLVEACTEFNCFLLQISTDFVFSGDDGPYDEEAIPAPVNFYGETKLRAENHLKSAAIDWAIVRTVLVYGYHEQLSRSNIILWTQRQLEAKQPIRVVIDQFRTPTLVEDLAMGCYLIIEKQAKGVYNISGGELMRPYDMSIATARYLGLDESLISKVTADTFVEIGRRPLKTGLIITKAKRELGYEPHSFAQGLSQLLNNKNAE